MVRIHEVNSIQSKELSSPGDFDQDIRRIEKTQQTDTQVKLSEEDNSKKEEESKASSVKEIEKPHERSGDGLKKKEFEEEDLLEDEIVWHTNIMKK